MILSNPQRDSITEGIGTTTKMNISADIEAHLIKVVTEWSYEDILGSVIREQISNGIDSHMEANVTDPVIIRLLNENGNYSLHFIDVGLGLDKEGFEVFILGIGQSSKRNNPNLLGGYGLGSKNPLGYQDSYIYICRKDGIERKFIVFKGEEVPESTMVYEKPTEERNGVEIIININYSDRWLVVSKIKEQCSYFENVYFDVSGIDNTYKIFKNDLFKFNTLGAFTELHISLKNVAYSIDWKKLGIPQINIPIALTFDNYDEIHPIFNRESIEMTRESKKAIKNKIKEVSEWFCQEYNNQTKEYESLLKAWDYINEDNKYVIVGDEEFEITQLEQYSSIPCKKLSIKGVKLLSPKKYRGMFSELTRDFDINSYMYNGRLKTTRYFSDSIIGHNCVIINHNLSGFFREFLKREKYKYVFKESYVIKEDLRYYKSFILQDIPKKHWRDTIKEYKSIKEEFIKELFDDGRELHLSPEFLDFVQTSKKIKSNNSTSNYVSRALNKQKGDITIDWVVSKEIGYGYKLYKKKHAIKDLGKLRHLSIICENKEQAIDLRSCYSHVCTINSRDIKHINHHNFIMLAQIRKSPEKVKLVKKHLTAMLFEKELDIFNTIWHNSTEQVLDVLTPLQDSKNKLRTYVLNNKKDVRDSVLFQELIRDAEEKQEFDMTLWKEYKEVEEANKTFNFLRFFDKPQTYRKDALTDYTKFINEQLLVRKLSGKFPELNCFTICVNEKETVPKEQSELELEFETSII